MPRDERHEPGHREPRHHDDARRDDTGGRSGDWHRGDVAFRGAGHHAATPVRNSDEMRVPPRETSHEPGAQRGDRFDASGGYSEDRSNRRPEGPGAREHAQADSRRTPTGHRGEQSSEYGRGRDGGMPGRTGGSTAGSGSAPEHGGLRPSGRGKGPKNFTRSDERILEDVCHLLEDADVDASRIEVRVTQGEVTLEGNVDDRASKRAVEDIVYDTRGVKQCHNLLRVGER